MRSCKNTHINVGHACLSVCVCQHKHLENHCVKVYKSYIEGVPRKVACKPIFVKVEEFWTLDMKSKHAFLRANGVEFVRYFIIAKSASNERRKEKYSMHNSIKRFEVLHFVLIKKKTKERKGCSIVTLTFIFPTLFNCCKNLRS
jgi:hypothetical protein